MNLGKKRYPALSKSINILPQFLKVDIKPVRIEPSKGENRDSKIVK